MDATPHSVIVGFTPVNPAKRQFSSHGVDGGETASGNSTLPSRSSAYAARQKRKRSQASGSIAAPKTAAESSKPKSVSKPNKTRNPTDQDISRGLKVTKQIHPTAFKPTQDTCNLTSTETAAKNSKSYRTIDTSFLHESSCSLGENYQAAYLEKSKDTMAIDTSTISLSAQTSDSSCFIVSKTCVTGAAGGGWMSPTTIQPQARVACGSKDPHDNPNSDQGDTIFHCKNLSQSQREFQADPMTPCQQLTKSNLPAILQPKDLCSSFLTDDGSEIQQTGSSFVLYEDPEMLLHADAAMNDFQAVPGQLLGNSYDDDFPMEDEGIEEMLKLTEIKQGKDISTSNLAFKQGHSNDTCLTNDLNLDDLGWLDDFPCLDRHKKYDDGEGLPQVVMNRSDEISLSTSDSKSPYGTSFYSTSFNSTNQTVSAKTIDADGSDPDENFFNDDDLDSELRKMVAPVCGKAPKLSQSIEPDALDAERLLPLATVIPKPMKLSSPSFPTDIPHIISFDADNNPIPFTRPPFPKTIRDRSPIPGLGTHMVLRSCFRIGEALNAASVASRSNADAIIELYARVISSERESGSFKQTFEFADLFTADKPPFLGGTYTLWKGVKLWDHDAKAFLGEKGRGKMARIMGRIKREPTSKNWEMAILSVWQIDWADVGIAKGIVLS